MTLDKQFLFIIGAPRSGTTWLQAMVGAHPLICTTDELKLFDFFTGPWAKSWESLLRLQNDGRGARRHGLTGVWSEDEFRHFLREFLERVYTRVLERKPEAIVILDKTPGYSEYVEHINWLVPQAKFIHLIRDGRDVVVSLQAASQGWAELWAPSKVESAAFLWSRPFGSAKGSTVRRSIHGGAVRGALDQRGPDTLLDIRICRRTGEGRACGVDLSGSSVPEDEARSSRSPEDFGLPKEFFRRGQAGDWRAALSPQQRYFIHVTAGDLLGQLGYAGDSWWVEGWHQRFTLPLMAMLQSRNRMRSKTLQAVRRALGPVWIERIRAARTWRRARPMGSEGGAGTP